MDWVKILIYSDRIGVGDFHDNPNLGATRKKIIIHLVASAYGRVLCLCGQEDDHPESHSCMLYTEAKIWRNRIKFEENFIDFLLVICEGVGG